MLKGRVEMTNEPRDRRLAVGGGSRAGDGELPSLSLPFFLLSVVFFFLLFSLRPETQQRKQSRAQHVSILPPPTLQLLEASMKPV